MSERYLAEKTEFKKKPKLSFNELGNIVRLAQQIEETNLPTPIFYFYVDGYPPVSYVYSKPTIETNLSIDFINRFGPVSKIAFRFSSPEDLGISPFQDAAKLSGMIKDALKESHKLKAQVGLVYSSTEEGANKVVSFGLDGNDPNLVQKLKDFTGIINNEQDKQEVLSGLSIGFSHKE